MTTAGGNHDKHNSLYIITFKAFPPVNSPIKHICKLTMVNDVPVIRRLWYS